MPLPAAVAVPVAAGIVGDLFSAAQARREAEKNRQWQERMSSTAHQREVEDLKRAGLNPALSAMRGSGASTPSGAVADVPDYGAGVARGISSALAVRAQKAQIELLEAQADREGATAGLARTQAADISTTGAAGRYRELAARADISEAEAARVVEKLQAEIEQLQSASAQARARTELDKLLKAGYANTAELEKALGTKSPAVRLLLEILRGVAPYRDR